jgi:2-phospho-L-lactate guanylyltransferase
VVAPDTAVLIPVKAFTEAKARLAPALDADERAALAESMATTVLRAASPLRVWVVCDDEAVADWATNSGADVLWKPGRGLNGAVAEGVTDLARNGIARVIVVHADLPHARDLTHLAARDGITLVPDRRGDGTNVIVLPTDSRFEFSYGPGSFSRHVDEAHRRCELVHIEHDERLGWDVDVPADLVTPQWCTTG